MSLSVMAKIPGLGRDVAERDGEDPGVGSRCPARDRRRPKVGREVAERDGGRGVVERDGGNPRLGRAGAAPVAGDPNWMRFRWWRLAEVVPRFEQRRAEEVRPYSCFRGVSWSVPGDADLWVRARRNGESRAGGVHNSSSVERESGIRVARIEGGARAREIEGGARAREIEGGARAREIEGGARAREIEGRAREAVGCGVAGRFAGVALRRQGADAALAGAALRPVAGGR
jgi:hypothetical protein